MKKIAWLLTAIATLASDGAFAQSSTKKPTTGAAAQAATYSSTSDNFAWGIGLGGLLVIGLVAGLAAGAGSQSSQ